MIQFTEPIYELEAENKLTVSSQGDALKENLSFSIGSLKRDLSLDAKNATDKEDFCIEIGNYTPQDAINLMTPRIDAKSKFNEQIS